MHFHHHVGYETCTFFMKIDIFLGSFRHDAGTIFGVDGDSFFMNFLANNYSTPLPSTRPHFDEFTYNPWLDGSSDPPDGNQVERFTVGRKWSEEPSRALSLFWE